MSTPFRPLLAALAVAAAALALAACGSSSPSSTGEGSSDEEKQLAFQDCMRRGGLDVQIMDGGRGVAIGARAEPGGGGPPQNADRVIRACHESTGWAPPEPSDEEKSEMRDRALRFAQCMREHGVDVDDPAPDGRMMMRVERDSPTMRAAQEACSEGEGMFGRSAAPAGGASGSSDAP